MLYQNISPEMPLKKTNSLFNIREKNYNENKTKANEPQKNFMSNCQNLLSKCNSMNYSKKNKPFINKNMIRNNINKKKELMEKIRYISNKIDETINLYKDKKYINPNNTNNNEIERKNYINKYNQLPLNFQYNNSRILENMRKENEKQADLTNLKIKNISQLDNNPINIYKRICNNNNQESKKIKANYAKLNKQKKFYIDNNINLNKINDNKINNENTSNYYRDQKRKENMQQIYRYSEPFINGYNHKEENIFNRCCHCKNKKINNKEQITYIRNNSFDESINAKKNNYQVIKNLKKNMYEKEFSNGDANKNNYNYNTEKNKHKRNKSKSQYIYTMRNINEKYDNNYYKEIVHKKRDNSSINNDSLIEMRNNKSVDMNKNFVINRENSANNKVFERNNSYDYQNELSDYNEPINNKISRNERYQNSLNDINRENYNEEDLNQENMRENNENEEMNYQEENNNIENNYQQEELDNNISNKNGNEDDINMDENNNYFENQNKENNINNENINYEKQRIIRRE